MEIKRLWERLNNEFIEHSVENLTEEGIKFLRAKGYRDTPKELVRGGDILAFKDMEIPLYFTDNGSYAKELLIWDNEISKIWTPNEQGDFIKQWEAKK